MLTLIVEWNSPLWIYYTSVNRQQPKPLSLVDSVDDAIIVIPVALHTVVDYDVQVDVGLVNAGRKTHHTK